MMAYRTFRSAPGLLGPGLLLLLLVTACSSNKPAEPAPLMDFEPAVAIERLWKTDVGDGQGDVLMRLTPGLDRDVVYAASVDGEIEARGLSDGKRRWLTEVDRTLTAGVGVGEGLVLVVSLDGEVIALDQLSGEILWVTEVASQVLSSPATNGHQVVLQGVDGRLIGLSAANGGELWTLENAVPLLTQRGTAAPVLNGNEVITGLANGKVISVVAETGQLRWEARVSIGQGRSELERLSDVDGQPLVRDDTVYAVSFQGNLVAIDRRSGGVRWRVPASSHVGPAEGFGNIYVAGAAGSVEAYSTENGLQRWQQPGFSHRRLTRPVTDSSYVLVGDRDGYVHVLSQVDGQPVGRYRVDRKGLWAPLQVSDGIVVAYGNSGQLVAFRVTPL